MLSEPSLQLDLEEAELIGVRVDHVVRDALGARVRDARLELGFTHACGFLQPQLAGGERHDHVVVGVNMMAGLGAWREALFGDDDALGFDLGMRGGFHGRKFTKREPLGGEAVYPACGANFPRGR
mgnify:CR=1 FL=1